MPDTPSGFPIRFVGGMGLAIWPMELKLTQRVHTNVGLGISGRLMVKVGDHLRLQAGLFQGNFGEEDKTQVQRNFIFAGIEGSVQLPADFYLNLGARFGGSHLEMVETLQRKKDDQRLVNDIDIWSPMVQPIVAAGCLLKKKYHVEVEAGTALTYIEGGWQVSYTALVGVYFAMGGFEI